MGERGKGGRERGREGEREGGRGERMGERERKGGRESGRAHILPYRVHYLQNGRPWAVNAEDEHCVGSCFSLDGHDAVLGIEVVGGVI